MLPDWAERFWAKVNVNGPIPKHRPDLGPCHLWTAAQDRDGYGLLRINGLMRKAHRLAYELASGPIPKGLEPDHLCRVPACVRRSHLEAVTRRENFLRGNHPNAVASRTNRCRNGHSLTPENSKPAGGRRRCRACYNAYMRRWLRAKKETTL